MTELRDRATHVDTRINGERVVRDVRNRMTLAQLLRDELGLTGTKVSCDMEVCGVCTVLVDGEPISACTYLAAGIHEREVTTVEGLADGDRLHPVQQAFLDKFALQCGFCTPGFIMAAVALLAEHPDPDEETVVEHLEGNICRCTGYRPIVDAVLQAAQHMKGADDA